MKKGLQYLVPVCASDAGLLTVVASASLPAWPQGSMLAPTGQFPLLRAECFGAFARGC